MTRPRILLVSPVRPIPATGGGRQRSDLIWRALARVADVDLFVTEDSANVPDPEQRALGDKRSLVGLQGFLRRAQQGPWKAIRPIRPKLIDRLAHNLGATAVWFTPDPLVAPEIRRVVAERKHDLIVGRYLRNSVRAGLADFPATILDLDDPDTSVYEARLREPGLSLAEKLILKKHLDGVRRALPRHLPRFAATWITSERDRPAAMTDIIEILPNIPWQPTDDDVASPLEQAPDSSRRIMVIGSWGHTPNAHGLDTFLRESWPAVRAEEPGATLAVYGSQLTDAKRNRWGAIPGVEVIGFVDRVEDAYRDAAFAISPVIHGGGTKIKVLEALRFQRAAVISAHSHRGFEETLRDGEALLVARDSAEFASLCVALLRDPARRRELAGVGHQAVQHHYSFSTFCDIVARTVDRVLSRASAEVAA